MTATDDLDPGAVTLPVVAVVVSRDPGPWLEPALSSLGGQDYDDLSVLVIDAASAEPLLPRVADVAPAAFVRRLDDDPGFGPAANHVLGMVEGAAFYLFCHDDVVLDQGAVRALVEEALRSNAGVVGPKLVLWDDPSRLLQVGMAADKGGVLMPLVERGELDQEQHDAVRDVFVVPGACTLVRADLFATLGGFDPGIDRFGEDLDLCWRAQVAGARVLVAPAARARHREGLVDRVGADRAGLLRNRHRLRTVLTCYGRFHLLRVIPQLLVLAVAELLYAVATRSRAHVRRVVGSWWWNWQRKGELVGRRRALKAIRRFPDREVRKLQVGGSARLRRFVRGELAATKLGEELEELGDELEEIVRARPRKLAAVAWAAAVVLFVVGTRSLLLHRLPAVGGFAPFDVGPVELARRFTAGWQPMGLGSATLAPTAFGLLAVGGGLLLGAMGVLQQLLVLGLVPAGAAGLWRLTRPLGSPNARGVGLLLYVVVPLPWDGIARGSWAGLILYAAAPWMLSALLSSSGEPPGDEAPRRRPLVHAVLALGLLLAAVAAFVPLAVPLLVVVAATLVVGSLVGGHRERLFGPVVVALGAAAVAVVLHLPWLVSLVGGDRWSLAGVGAGAGHFVPVGELLRFETGPVGDSWLGWSIPAAAALPLLIGRAWRFRWALRCWCVALACWGLAVAAGRTDIGLPPAEVLLAPGAAALALAAALGVSAFELDLRGFRFGWRQLASIAAGGAAVLATLPIAFGALDGSWELRSADHTRSLAPLGVASATGGARLLWIGHPESLPVAGHPLGADLAFAVTTDTTGGLLDRWVTGDDDALALVRRSLEVARSQGTDRLGELLAPFGIRYVVLADRAAPERTGAEPQPVPARDLEMASRQLDLRPVQVEPALHVFENAVPAAVRQSFGTDEAVVAALGSADPLAGALALPPGTAALAGRRDGTDVSGPLPAGALLLAAPADGGWRLVVGDRRLARQDGLGWANAWVVPDAGAAHLERDGSLLAPVLALVQVAAWAAVVVLVVRHRRSGR